MMIRADRRDGLAMGDEIGGNVPTVPWRSVAAGWKHSWIEKSVEGGE